MRLSCPSDSLLKEDELSLLPSALVLASELISLSMGLLTVFC